MKNQTSTLRSLLEVALYAALITVVVMFIRIPVGAQMVHIGNALVVVGVLLFGSKRGAAAAALGLGIFDLLSGYAASAWITVLESLIVCVILAVFYEKFLKGKDSIRNVIVTGIVAAIAKIIMNLIKYTIYNLIGAMPIGAAISAASVQIMGSYGTAIVTIIATPLLYPAFKAVLQRIK